MKTIVCLILFTLVGCAVIKEPLPRVNDSRWSDYVHEIMMGCGEAAAKLAGPNDTLSNALYNQCLRDMNATL